MSETKPRWQVYLTLAVGLRGVGTYVNVEHREIRALVLGEPMAFFDGDSAANWASSLVGHPWIHDGGSSYFNPTRLVGLVIAARCVDETRENPRHTCRLLEPPGDCPVCAERARRS